MKNPQNINEAAQLNPDFMGFIFYKKSPRYLVNEPNMDSIQSIDRSIQTVGVFVNEPIESLESLVNTYQLDFVQLHGGESIDYCSKVKSLGIKLIKVFSVEDSIPMEEIKFYKEVVDYFLFDTKTPQYGGSGAHFDWSILEDYNLDVPFFLSGGIKLEDLETIKNLELPMLFAIDVNSKFETAPGLKNIELLRELDKALQIDEHARKV